MAMSSFLGRTPRAVFRTPVQLGLLLLLPLCCWGRHVDVENSTQLLSELQAWTGDEGEPIDLFLPQGSVSFQGVAWAPGFRSIRNGSLSVWGAPTVLDVARRRPGARHACITCPLEPAVPPQRAGW